MGWRKRGQRDTKEGEIEEQRRHFQGRKKFQYNIDVNHVRALSRFPLRLSFSSKFLYKSL